MLEKISKCPGNLAAYLIGYLLHVAHDCLYDAFFTLSVPVLYGKLRGQINRYVDFRRSCAVWGARCRYRDIRLYLLPADIPVHAFAIRCRDVPVRCAV